MTFSIKRPRKQTVLKELRSWGIVAAIGLLIYLGNSSIQNNLGQQAFADTGLANISLEQALVLAKEQNKPIVADLSAYWCGSCRKLDQHVLANDMVKEKLNSDYIFARIDSESSEAQAFMQRYGARGYPTVLILDKNGNKLKQLPYTTSPHKFVDLL